jgi:hypothetical protein
MPIVVPWEPKVKSNDFLAIKRSAIAEQAYGSCSELPIELVEYYFPESIDQAF